MTLARGNRSFWLLSGVAALVPAASALAQTAPAPSDGQDVTVTGQHMPGPEAPRSATCEALVASDPSFVARLAAGGGDPLMGPRPYLPTRPPRNPDYSKPPLVPPGSALPTLPESRFGLQSLVLNDSNAMTGPDAIAVFAPGAVASPTTTEQAVQACRTLFQRGGVGPRAAAGAGGDDRYAAIDRLNQRFQLARSVIVGKDRSLPMAFALFDQGRYAEALDWFRKAAIKLSPGEGGDEATLFVGKIYLQGLGDRSDPAEAVKWLEKAATMPFNPVTETPMFDPAQPDRNTAIGEAAVILANLYRTGFGGVARDSAAARKWYARANAVGHVPATKLLGDLALQGSDAPRDAKTAQSLYQQAAKLDYAPAQVALAELLMTGEDGVKQDRKKALAWYRAAAKKNHPEALYALARAYDLGEDVRRDPRLALGFYKSAALHGSVAARVSMGTYFYEGTRVAKDDATARRWFEAAAKEGDSDGMFNLAAMLAKGEGGDKNMVAAWMWMQRAAARGHANAPRAIAALEARMTPDEKRRAAAARGG